VRRGRSRREGGRLVRAPQSARRRRSVLPTPPPPRPRVEVQPHDRPVQGDPQGSRRQLAKRPGQARHRPCHRSPRRPPRRPRASAPPVEASGPRSSTKAPAPWLRLSLARGCRSRWRLRRATRSSLSDAPGATRLAATRGPDAGATPQPATVASGPSTATPPIGRDRRWPAGARATRARSPGGDRSQAAGRSPRRPPIPGLAFRGEPRERCSRP
jgi:hypothetical protein